ncbi:MAG: hypothetical protein P8X74_24205 [Reinekea sp.]
MTEAKNANTDNQDDDEFALEFKTIGWLSNLVLGKLKKLWPDWRCTQTLSPKTRPVRKAKRLRGQKVEPIEHYGFHTPFEVKTDGQQWIISTNTKVTVNRIAAMMLLFFFIFCAVALYFTYPAKGAELFIFLASILGLAALYNIIKARLGGEDTWVIFDRTTGNVCFWRKNAKNSLTVPFDDEEMEKEISEIEKKIEQMMQAPNFDADSVIQFYKESPGFSLENNIRHIAPYIQRRIRYLKIDNLMDRGFRKRFTMVEYRRDLNKLIQFFGPIINDISASYNSKEESSYIKLDVLDEV